MEDKKKTKGFQSPERNLFELKKDEKGYFIERPCVFSQDPYEAGRKKAAAEAATMVHQAMQKKPVAKEEDDRKVDVAWLAEEKDKEEEDRKVEVAWLAAEKAKEEVNDGLYGCGGEGGPGKGGPGEGGPGEGGPGSEGGSDGGGCGRAVILCSNFFFWIGHIPLLFSFCMIFVLSTLGLV